MTKQVSPKVAGQILSNGKGATTAIVGETLAEALDIDTWAIVEDTIPKRAPRERARALEAADALLKSVTTSRN